MERDRITRTINNLNANRISCIFFEDAEALFLEIEKYITPGIMVGVGDSITLEDLGIYDLLRKSNVSFLDKYREKLTKEEKRTLYIKNFSSDLFISGINALTEEGKIYNLDGNGSRVAPIIYGPKKVILICGVNKIVKDDESAIYRIRNIAAPLDAKRLGKRTPCVKTGKCMNCKSMDKICNYYTIIQGQFDADRIRVFLINRELGY